jgi:uncharacterized membrane protein
MKEFTCFVTHKKFPQDEVYKGDMIRNGIVLLIEKDYPGFGHDSYICIEELNKYRKQYLTNLIKKEDGELNDMEAQVVDAISRHDVITENIETDLQTNITFGQRTADGIAKFGGSWNFIIVFFFILTAWIGVNTWLLVSRSFDPYPFILLNLILSCLAAIQAPVIMMSQNRKEDKDRKRSENDFKVNLKAEIEIRTLNEKLDHLITHQNKRLIEIQELQTDYLEDIIRQLKNNK